MYSCWIRMCTLTRTNTQYLCIYRIKWIKLLHKLRGFIENKLYKMYSKSGSRYHKPCNYCMFYFVTNMFCVLAGAIFVFHDYLIGTGTIVYSLYGQWQKPQLHGLNQPMIYRNKPQLNVRHGASFCDITYCSYHCQYVRSSLSFARLLICLSVSDISELCLPPVRARQ